MTQTESGATTFDVTNICTTSVRDKLDHRLNSIEHRLNTIVRAYVHSCYLHGRYDEAEQYDRCLLKMARDSDDKGGKRLYKALVNLANDLFKQNKPGLLDECEALLREAIKLAYEVLSDAGDLSFLAAEAAGTLTQLAQVLLAKGEVDKAYIEIGNLLKLNDKAVAELGPGNGIANLVDVYEILAQIARHYFDVHDHQTSDRIIKEALSVLIRMVKPVNAARVQLVLYLLHDLSAPKALPTPVD